MQFDLNEAQKRLPELVNAALKGEEIIIKTDDSQLVQLRVLKSSNQKRVFGTAKGQIEFSLDFDKPLDDFKECQ